MYIYVFVIIRNYKNWCIKKQYELDGPDTGVFRHISSVPDDEINLEAYPPPRFICQYANGNVWARKKITQKYESSM